MANPLWSIYENTPRIADKKMAERFISFIAQSLLTNAVRHAGGRGCFRQVGKIFRRARAGSLVFKSFVYTIDKGLIHWGSTARKYCNQGVLIIGVDHKIINKHDCLFETSGIISLLIEQDLRAVAVILKAA